jgi:hypothetical protein
MFHREGGTVLWRAAKRESAGRMNTDKKNKTKHFQAGTEILPQSFAVVWVKVQYGRIANLPYPGLG